MYTEFLSKVYRAVLYHFLGANAPLRPASSEGLYVCLYVCLYVTLQLPSPPLPSPPLWGGDCEVLTNLRQDFEFKFYFSIAKVEILQ